MKILIYKNEGEFIDLDEWLREVKTRKVPLRRKVYWKLKNAYDFFRYDLPYGTKGLIRWAKFAWRYRTWDFAYMLEAMEMCLTDLERNIRVHGHHVNAQKDAKEIRIALHYLKKFQEENYTVFPKISPGIKSEGWAHVNKDNWDYLWKHIGKNVRGWWD